MKSKGFLRLSEYTNAYHCQKGSVESGFDFVSSRMKLRPYSLVRGHVLWSHCYVCKALPAAGALQLCYSKSLGGLQFEVTSLCGVRSLMRIKLSELEERESLVHLSYCSRGQRMATDAMAMRC